MTASVFVEAFLFRAARIAMASGGSPFALALDISDKTTPSLRDIDASSKAAFRFFNIPLIIFLLNMIQRGTYNDNLYTYQSSASAITKLLDRSINLPYLLRYLTHVAWNVPINECEYKALPANPTCLIPIDRLACQPVTSAASFASH